MALNRETHGPGPIQIVIEAAEEHLRESLRRLLGGGSPDLEISIRWNGAPAVPSRPGGYARRLPIPQGEGVIRYLEVGQVDWIEAANQYVRLHVGKRSYLVRESMGALASSLDPERFQRIHRSAIVNLDRIDELRASSPSQYRAVLRDGKVLPVSPQQWDALKSALAGLP